MSGIRTVVTQNSSYEIDMPNKLIRRTKGVNEPTPYQGADNVWHPYATVTNFNAGLWIRWDDDGHQTATSSIQSDSLHTDGLNAA